MKQREGLTESFIIAKNYRELKPRSNISLLRVIGQKVCVTNPNKLENL